MRVTEDMIDPELRFPAKLIRLAFGKGKASEERVRRSKTPLSMRVMGRLPQRGVSITERYVPRGEGPDLKLVVATRSATAGTKRPGILWIHGGAYSVGTARSELSAIRELLGLTDAVFVSPEYRLSTEAPYPAGFDDCYTALLWLHEHADELGVRSDQIIVAGGSAGGGMTAAITIRARNEGKVNVAFQMPLYPMIDDRFTASSRDNDAPLYDGTTNESNWRVYLGDLYGGDVPPTAAPARETDYRGLPPTLTFVGGVEPFRDETITYVENLRAAGVPVEFREFPGAWHGFDSLVPRAKISQEAKQWKQERFVRYLATYFAEQPGRS
ncbi:MAG: alpha/beta hydrolase [Microbacterium sp.]|uniref:alpha/beta hydrolase n=1 Tax=Microbacterium sp. TaxID=51671 RepID=UPI0027229351|nr:alpha/beta hydrolase [Microbacterium sp.]MDO8382476.1 alpha/beta hydrolase [Microbacterium sp.]